MRPVITVFLFLLVSIAVSAQLITPYSVQDGLPDNSVTALYRDNEGYLWCGTAHGLVVFDGWDFHRPRTTSEKNGPAMNRPVHAIIGSSDGETVWIGTDSVIMQMDRYSLKLLRTFDVSKKRGTIETPILANDTAVWLSCSDIGLYRVRIADGKTTVLSASGAVAETQALLNGKFVCVADSTDSLIFCDISTSELRKIPLPGNVHTSDIHQITEFPGARQSVLLLSTKGLWRCDYLTGTIQRYFLNESQMDTLYDFRAMSVHPDGSWWFATASGVYVYDFSGRRLSLKDNGDTAIAVVMRPVTLLCDAYGVTWCGTEQNGLLKMLHGRFTTAPYGEPVVLCFGKPTVVITDADSTNGSSGIIRESMQRVYGSEPITFTMWQTDFAFPEKVKFEYQLEGYDAQKIISEGKQVITYSGLGSGFYSLLCSVTTPGCNATGTMKLGTIKITPPFWMSGWFIGISSMGAVLIITLILFVVMRRRYQRKIRKFKMQQELDKIRQRISRDIHDEIGAGLTRIALSGDLMAQKITAQDASHEKLKWIAGTARELSQSMKEVVWSVNPHYDSLDHMAAYFRSYVAGVAENADVRFVYAGDDNLPPLEVNPETRRNLLLILKEAVSNAVKYSGATELKLEIQWRNQQLHMTIADNGKGFDIGNAAGVNSNGLRNMRQRAETSGCTLSITSTPESGTAIRITGPLTHSAT